MLKVLSLSVVTLYFRVRTAEISLYFMSLLYLRFAINAPSASFAEAADGAVYGV